MAMAPLGFLQKDVKTAHSTKTMILYDFFTFSQKQLMLPAHMKTVLSFVGIHAIIGFLAPHDSRFVLKSLFVSKYLWGVSTQFS